MNLTRSSARSAAVARALHRRRHIEAQTPILFDNTPSNHDGHMLHVERDELSPAASRSLASIPPTSQTSTTAGANERDREAPAAGQNGGSGVEVAKTTVPQRAETPTAGAAAVGKVRACPCGCGSDLGPIDGTESGRAKLVCRSFWFSLPHEVRRRVHSGSEDERVAACRMVLKMAIAHRRHRENPATEGRAQREVAPRGEPERARRTKR